MLGETDRENCAGWLTEIGIWPAGSPILPDVGPPAAFFDLDKTILARSSTLAFGRPFRHNGLINRRTALKAGYAQLVYLALGADEGRLDRLRDRASALCAGWDVEQVRGIVRETVHDVVNPLVHAEAAHLIDRHRAAGHDVIIVSSSGQDVVEPIGEMLGVDHVIATRMVVADGRYTGEVAFYAYGENKARAVRETALTRGYELSSCYAYSDSATDLPLLEVVGHPAAVNPDRALRRIAAARGWPVLTFGHPTLVRTAAAPAGVPATPSLAVPDTRAVSGPRALSAPVAVLALGTVLAGATWYAVRRLDRPRRRLPLSGRVAASPTGSGSEGRGSRMVRGAG